MMEAQCELAERPGKDAGKSREAVSPLNGARLPTTGRAKGVPNKVTRTIREAVEMAARDCHPKGLAGWLVERANGSLGDRQIFAAMVSKALPLQVNANVSGGITISMPWLGQRGVAGATVAQLDTARAQVIDSTEVPYIEHRITDAALLSEGVLPAAPAGAGQAGAEQAEPVKRPTRRSGA